MAYHVLSSLVVYDGIMYDCTSKVKKDVCTMRGICQKYVRAHDMDSAYYVGTKIRAYLAQAVENGTAAFAGLTNEKEAA